MKIIIIDSEMQKNYCRTMIDQIKLDGKSAVVFKKTDMSPTARQRRLWWCWCTEVSMSGLGQDDDKESVHVRAKWQFIRPILLRDDDLFGMIYNKFMEVVSGMENRSELCQVFAQDYISTERITRKQRAEGMSEFQRFWIGKGVELTNPDLLGLDMTLLKKKLAPVAGTITAVTESRSTTER